MTKHPRIPRVSIIVPFQRDEKKFEDTLISVLENQPAGCEVIVAHNGSYSDPFDLEGEVRFAVARSANLVDLIRDAFPATHAQFVHVVGTGLIAKPDWISHGLECFERSEVAAVAPTIQLGGSAKKISGWTDTPGRLLLPVDEPGTAGGRGCFLNACFFRRQLLGALLDSVAPALSDEESVCYAFGCLLNQAGWQVAATKQVLLNQPSAVNNAPVSDFDRGQVLAAIRSTILSAAEPLSLANLLREAVFGSSSFGEMFGMLRCGAKIPAVQRFVETGNVPTFDANSHLLRMPELPDRSAA